MSTGKLVRASVANLVIPATGLLVSPFLSRELGPSGRGMYAALTLPIVVYGWIGTYGLQDALSYHVREGTLTRRVAARVVLLASVPLGLLGVLVLGAVGLVIFDGHPDRYRQFLVLACFAPLHVTANLLIGALTGASDIRGVNSVKVLPALARTGLVIAACLLLDLDAFVAGLLFLISTLAGLVAGLRHLGTRGGTGGDAGAGDRDRDPAAAGSGGEPVVPVRTLLTYALVCLPGVLAQVSSARLDQIIGLPVIGARQLGYYAVAVSAAEIPMVIATAARTVLMGRPDSSDPRAATRVARIAVGLSVLACGALAAVASFAVPFVFGSSFRPAVPATMVLCGATVLYTCMTVITAVLLANGAAKWSSAALVGGSVLGVVLLFVLAPYGALGAAWASVGGYGGSVFIAAIALGRGRGGVSLRMLTVLYRDDLAALLRTVRTRLRSTSRSSVGTGR